MTLNMNRRKFITTALCAFAAGPARADKSLFHIDHGMAIGGFDPVSFFLASGPVRGRRDIAVMWRGAVWRFASPRHRDAFEADPWRYAPQYGGFCAYAVSQGALIAGDPLAWRVYKERLYVTADLESQRMWMRDMAAYIEKADRIWPKLLRAL